MAYRLTIDWGVISPNHDSSCSGGLGLIWEPAFCDRVQVMGSLRIRNPQEKNS